MKFYTYAWLRPDRTPYYVGKGTGRRANCSVVGHRPPKDKSRIVVTGHETEVEAFEREKELIAFWGRKDLGTGCLHNRSQGGEGSSEFSEATLQKLRTARKGKTPCLGHVHSLETRKLLSDKRQDKTPALGHKHSAETKAKIAATLRGKPNLGRLGKVPWNKGVT